MWRFLSTTYWCNNKRIYKSLRSESLHTEVRENKYELCWSVRVNEIESRSAFSCWMFRLHFNFNLSVVSWLNPLLSHYNNSFPFLPPFHPQYLSPNFDINSISMNIFFFWYRDWGMCRHCEVGKDTTSFPKKEQQPHPSRIHIQLVHYRTEMADVAKS